MLSFLGIGLLLSLVGATLAGFTLKSVKGIRANENPQTTVEVHHKNMELEFRVFSIYNTSVIFTLSFALLFFLYFLSWIVLKLS